MSHSYWLRKSIVGLAVGTAALPAAAQTSIAAENVVDTVSFSYTDGTGTKQQEHVTLVRDEREIEQWYYVPSRPTLVTTRIGSNVVPQFSLVSYDYRDPGNAATILRAGLLNFSARLSLPTEAIEPMRAAAREAVARRKGQAIADKIRIAALPINSATVSVYSSDGKLVGTAEGTGTAPTFASQTMAFSIPLTQLGTAVFNDLVKSPTGVRTAVQFTYNGMTPKCGYRVTADYSQARDFYSRNEKVAARASYYGLFGGSYNKETMDIRDSLVNAGALKIEVLASNQCPAERLDALMSPILKRINDQVLETFKPPAQIDPATAGTPSTGGYFGGVGYSVSVKQVSNLKKMRETISFEQATIVERTTVAQGFIGIGNYSDAIKNQLLLVVDGTINPGTYVAFPQVPQGVDRVDLDVNLRARESSFASGQYQYLRSANVWKNLQTGAAADRISFSLAGIEQAFGKNGLKDAELRITKVLSTERDSTKATSSAKVSEGAAAVELQEGLNGLRLSASGVTFRQLGGDIVRMQVTASAGDKSKSYVFQAFNANGTWQLPADDFFFAPEKGQSIELTVRAVRPTGAPDVTWKHKVVANGMQDIFLDDGLRQP